MIGHTLDVAFATTSANIRKVGEFTFNLTLFLIWAVSNIGLTNIPLYHGMDRFSLFVMAHIKSVNTMVKFLIKTRAGRPNTKTGNTGH